MIFPPWTFSYDIFTCINKPDTMSIHVGTYAHLGKSVRWRLYHGPCKPPPWSFERYICEAWPSVQWAPQTMGRVRSLQAVTWGPSFPNFVFRIHCSISWFFFRAGAITLTLGNLTALLKLSLSKTKLSSTMHCEERLFGWQEYHYSYGVQLAQPWYQRLRCCASILAF